MKAQCREKVAQHSVYPVSRHLAGLEPGSFVEGSHVVGTMQVPSAVLVCLCGWAGNLLPYPLSVAG